MLALAPDLIRDVHVGWVGVHRDYVVQCSKMRAANDEHCRAHVDNKNMSCAYELTLGNPTDGKLMRNDKNYWRRVQY